MNPLYVVTAVFNPRRFRSRYNLYQHFNKWVAGSGVRLLTVEVAFGEREHAVTGNDPGSTTTAIAVKTRIESGRHKMASIVILTSLASSFFPRYSGVRPTISPATNSATIANRRMP